MLSGSERQSFCLAWSILTQGKVTIDTFIALLILLVLLWFYFLPVFYRKKAGCRLRGGVVSR
jgi:hypothetical protein